MRGLIALAALGLVLSAGTKAAASGPNSVVDAFHADTTEAAAMLADDALIFEEGGAERSKAEYVAHHLPSDAEFSKTTQSVVTHRSHGMNGSLAWVASEGRTTGAYKGKPVDVRTTETMLLRRAGPRWTIVHIHWSSARR